MGINFSKIKAGRHYVLVFGGLRRVPQWVHRLAFALGFAVAHAVPVSDVEDLIFEDATVVLSDEIEEFLENHEGGK